MKTLKIFSERTVSHIYLGRGILSRIGEYTKGMEGRKAFVIMDRGVPKRLFKKLRSSLIEAGFKVKGIFISLQEQTKDLATLRRFYLEFLRSGLDRETPIFVMGGGLLGDIIGFVAATFMRGIPLFQIPTTLTAQVDSSIGGKVGVNLGGIKNLVGTFYQPRAIFIDPELLLDLPDRVFCCGLAEVVKYGIIVDKGLLEFLEKMLERIKSRDPVVVERMIFWCARLKARIVNSDERDRSGLRALLNYGHTIGHALEALYSHTRMHGEVLSLGLACEAKIAEMIGLAEKISPRQNRLLMAFGLPTRFLNPPPLKRLFELVEFDKKRRADKICFALPLKEGLGRFPVIVSKGIIAKAVKELVRKDGKS